MSARLRALAELAAPCHTLYDIGSDHALLPVHMLLEGKATEAVATDINAAPCERARKLVRRAGLSEKIKICRCDGLGAMRPRAEDSCVVAGMGGLEIARILQASSFPDCRLILQPNWNREHLRIILAERGYEIEERLFLDRSWLYHFFLPRFSGRVRKLNLAEAFLGEQRLRGESTPARELEKAELQRLFRIASDRSRADTAYLELQEEITRRLKKLEKEPDNAL